MTERQTDRPRDLQIDLPARLTEATPKSLLAGWHGRTFHVLHPFINYAHPLHLSCPTPRYGSSSELLELGRVTPGTYCTRQFDECYRKKCRLQSPNYPGMYPRNVTCYWTIRQKTVPTCKHAMIGVSQESEHKSLVKR